MIALVIAGAVALLLTLTLARLFAGPTLYDRALAVNAVVFKAALICAALAVALGRSEAVDAAFVLVLGAFVLNAAALKFFRAKTFQAPLARAQDRL
jgi:multicomponent Na+:H+ antiporter subunit F